MNYPRTFHLPLHYLHTNEKCEDIKIISIEKPTHWFEIFHWNAKNYGIINDGKLLMKVSVWRKLPDQFQFEGMVQAREREKQAHIECE